jgi:hypothetical protein
MSKIITSIFFLLLLNGCVQSSAFLGPAVTVASTGNLAQAGLSYASSQTIIKITGKTPAKNIENFLKKNKENKKNATDFFKVVNKVNKNSGIKNLANQ